MTNLKRLYLAAVPVNVVATLAWIGVFTFINAYVTQELGYSDTQWTDVTLWFTGSVVVWQIFCAEISRRIGRRMTVLTGLVVAALFYLSISYLKGLPLLRLSLAFLGLTQAIIQVVWFSLAAEAGAARPGYAMAIVQFIGTLVSAIVIYLGGRMMEIQNYKTMFFYGSGICLLSAIAFYVVTIPWKNEQYGEIVSIFKLSKGNRDFLTRDPFLWVLLAGICIEPFNFHTVNQLFPNMARDVFGLSEQLIGSIVGFGRIPALLTLLLVGLWIDKLRPLRFYGIGIVCAASGLIYMGFSSGSTGLIIGYILFYLGHGVEWASNAASINKCVAPKQRDAAFAVMGVAMTLATFVAGFIHNQLIRIGTSLPHVFIICALISCCGGILLMIRSYFARLDGVAVVGRADGINIE